MQFSGTKWCGTGDIASTYNDLGTETIMDRCCRTHDLCPVKIRAYQRRYKLHNNSLYTKCVIFVVIFIILIFFTSLISFQGPIVFAMTCFTLASRRPTRRQHKWWDRFTLIWYRYAIPFMCINWGFVVNYATFFYSFFRFLAY